MPHPPTQAPTSGKPLSQVAYDSLKTMILSGQVRPGERMSERELARRIRVSRTPLREALGRLERDGLAVSKPGMGYYALEFDPRVVDEIYEYRELLEIHAVRAAARRIGEAGVRELRGVMRRLSVYERKREPTLEELQEEVQLGLRIHEVIAHECANHFVCEALLQIYDRLRLLTWIDVLWIDKWPLTRKEHRDLVEAVIARNEKRATSIAARHVRRSREDSLRVITVQHRGTNRVATKSRKRNPP